MKLKREEIGSVVLLYNGTDAVRLRESGSNEVCSDGDMMGMGKVSAFANEHADVEVKEEHENGEVENRVEEPSANAVAGSFEEEMKEENGDVAGDIAAEQGDLAIEDEGEAGGAEAYGGPEAVGVNDGV